MKSLILHGDNTTASRNRLVEITTSARAKEWEILEPTEKVTYPLLETLSRSDSLFGQNRVVLIEEFIASLKTASDDLEKLAKFLKDSSTFFVFWEKKPLTPATSKKLSKFYAIEEFKLPNTLFAFVDSLSPGNAKKAIALFDQTVQNLPAEMILTMIARQLRLLLWARLDETTLKLPPWQKGKFSQQASKFGEDELQKLHTLLLDIDRRSKSSLLTGDLSDEIKLFLTRLG